MYNFTNLWLSSSPSNLNNDDKIIAVISLFGRILKLFGYVLIRLLTFALYHYRI